MFPGSLFGQFVGVPKFLERIFHVSDTQRTAGYYLVTFGSVKFCNQFVNAV